MQQKDVFYRTWPLRFWNWLDKRYALQEFLHALVDVPIPRSANTLYLGGITLFLFGIQAITGILLSIYYQPTPENAYGSILFIMNDVRFGWLIRSIHAWGANLMIIFCILHLLRVFVQGAYKPPRELTWMAGVLLLMLTLGFGFTGYLLPWDQRAFWATTVGSEIAGAIPLVGQAALNFLRGGPEITALTLSRFFGTHVLVLPVGLALLVAIHLVMVHQQGLADPTEPTGSPDDLLQEGAEGSRVGGSDDH
ncbi:MAG: Cytochrome b6 [Anaerolineales bacterium]|nr:Cytochrome b6 [Anaerolineales bacterium]